MSITSDPYDSTDSTSSPVRVDRTRWWLAAILLLAFVLRAWNLDWDKGTHLQPDERFWSDVAASVSPPASWDLGQLLDPETSTLNPRVFKPNYVYGTLPLWSSEAAAGVLMTDQMSWLVSAIDNVGIDLARNEPATAPIRERLRFNTGFDVTIVGRLMSVLVDTATVGVVFLLGRELAGRTTALLAALLQALTVLHIQYAHFLGSEPWVAFFVTTAVWGSVRLARGRGTWRTRALTAVAVGLAIASKLSGVAGAVAPVAAAFVVCGPELRGLVRSRIEPGVVTKLGRKLEPYVLMGLGAVLAYRIAQPYDFRAGLSLVYNDRFNADLRYLSDINQGGNWPWVQPLVGRIRLLHPLNQMFWWGMGPGLGLAAIVGVALAALRFRRGERFWAVPLSVIAAYLVLVSLQFYAIIRYLQPAYPTITALSAVGLVAAWNWAGSVAPSRPAAARVAKTMVAVCVGATVFWALAFVNGVYGNDNARLAAGDWMLDNLPAGAVVSQQAWDDPVPWGTPSPFEYVTLEPFSFGGDSPEHIEALIAGLDQVDYVIETSNKFYDSLPRSPARFPQTTEYYKRLFDGSLGFELIETFRNQPSLLGITIDDSKAEEAFTLYDHPTVYIWQKTAAFDIERAYALLDPDRARTAINVLPRDAFANAGMLVPDQYAAQQQGDSFSEVHRNDPRGAVAVVLWFAVLQIVSLACAPLLLRHAGRGAGAVYGLTKPLGLIMFALPVWLLVSWGWVTFSNGLVAVALVAIVSLSALTNWRRRPELVAIWRDHRRLILITEAVFAAVFLFVVALRVTNPDVWNPWRGGEKPMELAYFTAVTGSTTMPPFDPWFAGGSLNYYYLGWFMLAVPARLLGFAPDVAFNLGVATYAALGAVTVFSTAAMLAELARRRSNRSLPVAATGGIAAVLFMAIGNLDGFRQVVQRVREGLPLSQFDWWGPSRVNKAGAGLEVTEFPNFTVLFADLHPHFMAMPFFGLGIAGCIAFVERTRHNHQRASWVLAIGLGLGSGVMRMVHTWDFPAFAVLVGASIVLGWSASRGPVMWRARSAISQLLVAGVAHLLITAPYRAHNQVSDSGFHRAESSTNLDDWLVHWGIFLFIGSAYIGARLWSHRGTLVGKAASVVPIVAGIGFIGMVGLHLVVGSVAAWAFVALVFAALLVLAELRDRTGSTAHLIVAGCWLLGFSILVGVEGFTQNADVARLNTVFKFWLQVWQLFAIAAGFGAAWLLAPLLEARRAAVAAAAGGPRHDRLRLTFAAGLVMLIVASLVYPVLAIGPRQSYRVDTSLGPSLDGYLWLEPGVTRVGVKDGFGKDYEIDPGLDRPLIEWLQHNVEGRPTIVEGIGGSEYQWWSRISISTGLPTVIGWRWHQEQQRTLFSFEVNERNLDVQDFYVAQDQAAIDAFLRAYDVSYVIVGSIEAVVADPTTLGLFATNPSLSPVFVDGDLVIYEVAKRSLAQARGPILAIGAG